MAGIVNETGSDASSTGGSEGFGAGLAETDAEALGLGVAVGEADAVAEGVGAGATSLEAAVPQPVRIKRTAAAEAARLLRRPVLKLIMGSGTFLLRCYLVVERRTA